ncbi:hypothetical protein [Gulosibacter molinativorax]|uniref:Major tail protein n=1 Tax=Gulosibacter molinativorax TaxID=256821 RepID=A0ABT7CC46_9MICO|nr:hypothetical protein [Gulosibacter molinativorax]MDJ1372759.1 hypothetical protein [Gulosibacter molinativorax]QUY63352.1 Hypotetical protein [Gulosibacter molinativorax]
MADAQGFDVDVARIWQTGMAYIDRTPDAVLLDAAGRTALVAADGKIVVPASYENVGLWTKDGGPEEGRESEDPTEFYQPGYEIGGATSRTVALTLAEDNEMVRWLDTGKTPVAGEMTVGGGNDHRFPLLIVQKRRDGAIRLRNGYARVSEFAPESADRGTLESSVATFKWSEADELGDDLYWERVVPATVTVPAG